VKQSKVGERGLERLTARIVGRDDAQAVLGLGQDGDDFL
jgi:hypothetical protein